MKLSNKPLQIIAFTAALTASWPAWSLNSDAKQPIQIEADSAEMDDGNKRTTYRGHVVLTQGSMRLEADKVTIQQSSTTKGDGLFADGRPAKFKQEIDGKPGKYIRGRGNRIEYYTKSELDGGALDSLYYTEAEVDGFLTGKSDVGHTHDDRYYTEAELDSFLAGKSAVGHTHDDRYYTETELDSFLSGKSDVSHTHDDRYYTETEMDSKLDLKVDWVDLSNEYYNINKAMEYTVSWVTLTMTAIILRQKLMIYLT